MAHPTTPLNRILTLAVVILVAASRSTLAGGGGNAVRFDGGATNDNAGHSASGAGDVNGDGISDVIIGAPGVSGSTGAAYVVFGTPTGTTVPLGALGPRGFVITGINSGDQVGFSVSGAGDVNGDTLDDVVIGAPGSNSGKGEAVVVFGKQDFNTVQLGLLGNQGFRIQGTNFFDQLGMSVSGAGDVNGDGNADVIVGAPTTDFGDFVDGGQSHVVFGKASPDTVLVGSLGAAGFTILGAAAGDQSGRVSGAGDVNGDGLADVVIGAPISDPNGLDAAGTAYVVFGKQNVLPIDLANLGAQGFGIRGLAAGDMTGISVSGAGDVNADGLSDIIIGAHGVDGLADYTGASYIVFGKTDSDWVSLGLLGNGGMLIQGADSFDQSGQQVAAAGDIDGDGFADVLIGAMLAESSTSVNDNVGSAYLVYGKPDGNPVFLAALGAFGQEFTGFGNGEWWGSTVSAAGDMNGDGVPDPMFGGQRATAGGMSNAGAAYLPYTPSAGRPASATYRARSRNGDAPPTEVGHAGDGSQASAPDSRLTIDFRDGADPAGAASMETITLFRSSPAAVVPAANLHWRVETTRTNWTEAELSFQYADSDLLVADESDLRVYYSPDGNPPYVQKGTSIQIQRNIVQVTATAPGYYYLAREHLLFRDGFDAETD